ncbi:hypothetical protein EZS27_014565 [termite gut metagenome]|uniref:Uncharacterized protein n=1 Tax=termite gut metagenome TaxID=433724 RepID=A0A5J4RU86_9ZZZZ
MTREYCRNDGKMILILDIWIYYGQCMFDLLIVL